jgi:nucleoside-diphosphate-sugar epimerase
MDQVRPYLDLEDGVRAIRFVIDRDLFDNRVYNVLTENASVRQIVELITAELGEVAVEYVDTRIMNQLSYRVSAARFAETGFAASGSLADGIARTIRLLRGVVARPAGQMFLS